MIGRAGGLQTDWRLVIKDLRQQLHMVKRPSRRRLERRRKMECLNIRIKGITRSNTDMKLNSESIEGSDVDKDLMEMHAGHADEWQQTPRGGVLEIGEFLVRCARRRRRMRRVGINVNG